MTKSPSEKEKHHQHLKTVSSRSIALSMATNNVQASAVAAPQQAMPSTSQNATSPPSKRDLASWWKTFKKNARREEEKGEIANFQIGCLHCNDHKSQAAEGFLNVTQSGDREPFHQALKCTPTS